MAKYFTTDFHGNKKRKSGQILVRLLVLFPMIVGVTLGFVAFVLNITDHSVFAGEVMTAAAVITLLGALQAATMSYWVRGIVNFESE